MKRLFGLLLLSLLVSLHLLSCGPSEGQCQGVVKDFTDSVLTVDIDGTEVTFLTVGARLTAGAAVHGDSVTIDYRGSLSGKQVQALVISVNPRQGHYTDGIYNPEKELLTAPSTKEQDAELEKFVEEAEKHGH